MGTTARVDYIRDIEPTKSVLTVQDGSHLQTIDNLPKKPTQFTLRHPQVAAVLLANTGDDALGGSVFFVILI